MDNIHIIGACEREDKEKGIKKLMTVISAKNFPSVGRNIDLYTENSREPKQTQLKIISSL